MVGNTALPGVQDIVNRIKVRGTLSPEQFVDAALDLMGPLQVGEETRQELVEQAREGGAMQWGTPDLDKAATQRIAQMLQLIVAMREYQYN
jgi:hypothetical protein